MILSSFLWYSNLFVNAFFQLGYVRNNADKAVAFGKVLKGSHCLIEGFIIKRTLAFVNEHCIKLNATGELSTALFLSSSSKSAARKQTRLGHVCFCGFRQKYRH